MREGGILGSEGGREVGGGREGGRERQGGRGGREGREGGMPVIHILIGMFNFFLYRNVLFMNSNLMLPTVHIIK